MKLLYTPALLLCLFIAYPSFSKTGRICPKTEQLPGQYYMILYVESSDSDIIQAFIAELESLPNKIISVTHNDSTHEFTIVFTELIRSDTIFQILLKYFDDFEEVDGYYLN